MKALVTGATGFVGSHVAGRLAADNHVVHALIRRSSNRELLAGIQGNVEFHVIDGSRTYLADLIKAISPDVVFHTASMFLADHRSEDVRDLIESNIAFPCELVEAMVRNDTLRLVNCSSSWQHYQDSPYDPVCLYAATKQAFIDLLKYYVGAKGLAVIDLTLFDTYGPRDRRPKLFSALYRAAEGGQEIAFSPGEQLIDLVYIDDVVNAIVLAADRLMRDRRGRLESYAVSGDNAMRLRDVVQVFTQVTGVQPDVAWGRRLYRSREMMRPWTGGTRLPEWRAVVDLADGIRRMHESHVQDP
jgi:nucleoside-diphosphate-sugar epimerase